MHGPLPRSLSLSRRFISPSPAFLPPGRWLRCLRPPSPSVRSPDALVFYRYTEFSPLSRLLRSDVTFRDVRDMVHPRHSRHTSPPDTTTARCAAAETTAIERDTIYASYIAHTPCPVPPFDDKVILDDGENGSRRGNAQTRVGRRMVRDATHRIGMEYGTHEGRG